MANVIAEETLHAADSGNAAEASSDSPPVAEDAAPAAAETSPDVSPAAAVDEPALAKADEPTPVEAESGEAPPEAVVTVETTEPAREQITSDAAAETIVASDAALVDAPAVAEAPDAVVADATEAVAAPELVEVWRPGGRSEERRPRHDRNRPRHHARPQEGAAPVAATGEVGEAPKHERHRRGRRDRNNEFRKLRTDAPPAEGVTATAAVEGAPVREPREDKGGRPPRERFEGRDKDKGRENDRSKGKFGGRDKGRRDKGDRDKRPDGGPSHRQYATSASPRERDRPVDPNSPFAKLAALKEQLTANRKDQR
jgi:ATP-dependent RNA helicase SUPV3L1/SUV3